MAMTWRDLSLPNREEVWRQLRGLRVSPPGAAASDRGRRETLQSALEQAQQLMDAAESAGYATRPLQLFYALSQGGRAIAAASPRLPASIQVPDRDDRSRMKTQDLPWKLGGHGVKATNTSQGRIAKVRVHAEWTGLLPGVAVALGAECLKADEKISVGELWPLLPESHKVPLDEASQHAALSFEGVSEPLHGVGSIRVDQFKTVAFYEALLGYVPGTVRRECGDDQAKLSAFLDHYPSLAGYIFPNPGGGSIGWGGSDGSGTYSHLNVYWPYPNAASVEWGKQAHQLKATRYRGAGDWWVFPKVGSMAGSLHPLLAWWTVLFALSMMARYEPNNWARMIQIDSSVEASAIEHILDQALDVVPALLLDAIQVVGGT
ncbi:hypothetical protein AB0B68_05430 [Micromonospora sp. NPDC049049]|uniref:YaaC family protein n=1 Tax=Micromonospora sp. NPDC049049 TaxID=3155495 RepID=UPI0033F351BF